MFPSGIKKLKKEIANEYHSTYYFGSVVAGRFTGLAL
jgi:hypothetical protein